MNQPTTHQRLLNARIEIGERVLAKRMYLQSLYPDKVFDAQIVKRTHEEDFTWRLLNKRIGPHDRIIDNTLPKLLPTI